MFSFTRKKFPKRQAFHQSAFNEKMARTTAKELIEHGYLNYAVEQHAEELEENLAFHLYEYGIAGTFYVPEGKRIHDYRYIAADGEALMSVTGQQVTLKTIESYLEKRISQPVQWTLIFNSHRYVEAVDLNEQRFTISGSKRPYVNADFDEIRSNICLLANTMLLQGGSDERLYSTTAGGFYFLSNKLFTRLQSLPLSDNHKPQTSS